MSHISIPCRYPSRRNQKVQSFPVPARMAFTKLLKPVISLLQSRGIRIVIYLDDMLILDQSPDRVATAFHSIVKMLTQLGFLIKQEKCSQVPTQRIEFLGSLINSTDMLQAVPSEKLHNIQVECRKAYQNRYMLMTELSALLGRMIHCTQMGLAQAPLHYRALQRQLQLPEQNEDFLIKGLINRPPMVDLTSNKSIQQHSINPTSIRYGHIHGCFHQGMGSPMQWNTNGRTLEPVINSHINVSRHLDYYLSTISRSCLHQYLYYSFWVFYIIYIIIQNRD